MTKTQKRLLAAAAIAGLVGGAVAKAKTINDTQAMAGKQTSSYDRSLNGCNGKDGCSSKTNSTSTNSPSKL